MISVGEETPAALVQNFECWLQMVFDATGAHIKNVIVIVSLPRVLNLEIPNTVMFAL